MSQALGRLRRRSSGSGRSARQRRTDGVLSGQDLHAWLANAAHTGPSTSGGIPSARFAELPAPHARHQHPGAPTSAAIVTLNLAPKSMRQVGVPVAYCTM